MLAVPSPLSVKETPPGKAPDSVIVGVGGPVVVTVKFIAVVVVAVAEDALVIAGAVGVAADTVIVTVGLTAAGLTPFAAWTVKEKDPVALGVPDRMPLPGSRLRSAGSVPLATEKVGAGLPE